MQFKSKTNAIKLIGYVNSLPQISNASQYAIEFKLTVPRPCDKGERQYYDVINVYVSDHNTVLFCKNNLQKGQTIIVKGELRKFKENNTYKVCSSDISIQSSYNNRGGK